MTDSPPLPDAALPAVQDALTQQAFDVARLVPAAPMQPFDPRITAFIGALSRAIVRHPEARRFPEIVALGHWMRPAALRDLENRFRAGVPPDCLATARGSAFHVAPANVDTIFLYSCVLSLLAGNPNVVRLSATRSTPQVRLLLDILREQLNLPGHAALSPMLRFLTYRRDDRITEALSARSMLRVVWGGDQTVRHIRSLPLHPLGRDVSFPDRWSVSVISARAVSTLDRPGLAALARDFANDGYWFHQMACSSPRAVIWLGQEPAVAAAADRFWPSVHAEAARFAAGFAAADFLGKRLATESAILDGLIGIQRAMPDNLTSVAALTGPNALARMIHGGGGLFVETRIDALGCLADLLDPRCQTIASFGVPRKDWESFLSLAPRLADRVVPVGRALEFGPIWDGMDLLREFTRLVHLAAAANAG